MATIEQREQMEDRLKLLARELYDDQLERLLAVGESLVETNDRFKALAARVTELECK